MQQGNTASRAGSSGPWNQPGRSSELPSAQITAMAMRGFGQLCDLNIAATRVFLRTQARAASALGWPDLSGVFDQVDERARNVFATGAEQLVQTAQLASEAAADLQRQMGRVVETQAVTVAESLQQGLEQLGEQASEGLRQLCDTARESAEQVERMSQQVGQEVRGSIQEAVQAAQENKQREQQRRPNQGAGPAQGQDSTARAA